MYASMQITMFATTQACQQDSMQVYIQGRMQVGQYVSAQVCSMQVGQEASMISMIGQYASKQLHKQACG